MSQAAIAVRAVKSSVSWNDEVLKDLLALSYVRGVIFTNGKGRVIHANYEAAMVDGFAKIADLALAALGQTGVALKVGPLEVSACLYEQGVVLLSHGSAIRCAVLADAGANLGALLNHVRRLIREEAP